MEPFGLFNLLKSLLPQAENLTPPSAKNGETGATDDSRDNKAAPSANEPRLRTEETQSAIDEPQNAFVDFINRHDERKKQIKK